MNTETLIHELALDCRPVSPIGHPLVRFLRWALAAAVLTAAGVVVIRPFGSDWNSLLTPVAITAAVSMFVVFLLSSLAAFFFAVPDSRNATFGMILIAVVIVLFCSICFALSFIEPADSNPGLICVFRIVGLSIAPGVLLFYMLKRAAPMSSGLVGLLAALSSFALAEIGVQFLCHKTFASHIIVWHILPVLVLSLVGILVGRALFAGSGGELP